MIDTQIRIEERTKSGGWKLRHHSSNSAAAENYLRNHGLEDLRVCLPCGCILYDPNLGWERCATHAF